jgi:SAM-dependent methyltransferase
VRDGPPTGGQLAYRAAVRYQDVIGDLRESYDGGAAERDGFEKEPWKLTERAAFLARLQADGCQRLLEIGAGTGQDSLYFQDNGLSVKATDLSPEMVARCRAKGIDARVADFLGLDFPPESFDAAYALNCLLHVPNADLPAVLDSVHGLLRPGGWFFVAVYRGEGTEGTLETDKHRPRRFFSLRTDEQMRRFVSERFEIEDFHVVQEGDYSMQSMTLRRPPA